MAVDGPRPAESLRHLACSLAALDPAPWEKVGKEDVIIDLFILGERSIHFRRQKISTFALGALEVKCTCQV